jgi:tellurite methyltransferase
MKQPIAGFTQDEDHHWVAHLVCGHRRHVRHIPPFDDRPWTQAQSARDGMLGELMDCTRCSESEPPEGIAEYKRTRTFTENTVPAGLLRDHQTRSGVWAQIVVESGTLRLAVTPHTKLTLTAGQHAWSAPAQTHAVEPVGDVRFHVRFCRAPPHDQVTAGNATS